MPTRPPRVCPGCGDAVIGPCPTCKPAAWSRRPSSWAGGSTRRWRRFRADWLAEHPMCAGWPNGSCSSVAAHVDHIRNLATYPQGPEREAARFDRGNVQSLCVPCHQRKTHEEATDSRRLHRAQDTTGKLW